MAYKFINQHVYNRGKPPEAFLKFIIDWAKQADVAIFERNAEPHDTYSHIAYKLGPWDEANFINHRKAAMLEVIRVLAGFESTWNWKAGRDTGAGEQGICEMEAGILQCSGDSMANFPAAGNWARTHYRIGNCEDFRDLSRSDKRFAIEYCARLLRQTYKHHGPLKRKTNSPTDPRKSSIHPFLSRDAMKEFQQLLK